MLLVFAGFVLLTSLSEEPEVGDAYPTTRYEKCMVLYGDTVDESLCDEELIGG
jgi:hypothetical protein